MEAQTREHENVVILDLTGPLVAGVGDKILRQSMNELVVEGWEKILLNLSKVSRIDSTGIGELVASIKMAKRFGSTVRLVEISQQVRHILDLSRILPLLDFYEDEEEALKWSSEKAAEDDSPE